MFFSFCLWLPWSHPLLQVWPPVKTCPSIPLCPPSLLSSALTPPVSLPPPAPPGGPLAPHPAPTALPFLGSHVHLTPSLSASQVWQPLLGWAEASCWLLRAPGRPNLFCWGTAPLPLPELAASSLPPSEAFTPLLPISRAAALGRRSQCWASDDCLTTLI